MTSADQELVHIVDDDEAVRDSLAILLRTHGYRVATHASSRTFAQTAADLELGCIVTDVQMPDMDGLEMLQALLDAGVTWPAVVITGRGAPHIAEAAARLGAIFVEKPFSLEQIVAALSRARDA
ncbi:response regulator [Phenylobacterium sp.]|uniref:response regulator transcription factor n=1 Tax=Phenylobacterium sp. TaxID=1871053 RepID=UPI00301CBD1D